MTYKNLTCCQVQNWTIFIGNKCNAYDDQVRYVWCLYDNSIPWEHRNNNIPGIYSANCIIALFTKSAIWALSASLGTIRKLLIVESESKNNAILEYSK